MILLSDANVLIDLGHVGGLAVLTQIGPTEVLDVVLLECEHESQPNLVNDVRAAGIQVIETQDDWLVGAMIYHTGPLSLQNALNLYYIWLVEEAHRRGLAPAAELRRWVSIWPTLGRRLPQDELKRLAQVLQGN